MCAAPLENRLEPARAFSAGPLQEPDQVRVARFGRPGRNDPQLCAYPAAGRPVKQDFVIFLNSHQTVHYSGSHIFYIKMISLLIQGAEYTDPVPFRGFGIRLVTDHLNMTAAQNSDDYQKNQEHSGYRTATAMVHLFLPGAILRLYIAHFSLIFRFWNRQIDEDTGS
jgi:hypothetical protein